MSKRAVILHDVHAAPGRPDQSDTLVEAQAIAAALRRARLRARDRRDRASTSRRSSARSSSSRPRVVVNLVESLEGRGRLMHLVPALLESLGLPFTGCSASALR